MSSVDQYKCISCGAPIFFKPEVGKFKCDYCNSEYTEEELTAYLESLKEGKETKEETRGETSGEYQQYHCNNCGAEVVSDTETTATFCYYCHSPVIISSRLSGEFKPERIVPFKVSKDKAVEIFLDWAGGKKYVPNDFGKKEHIDKMTGIYIPYWSYDVVLDVDYQAIGENVSVWTSGDVEYTNTKQYSIVRSGDMEFNNIDELATDKFEERLLNGISPYEEDSEVEFSKGYLSGFFAESFNVDRDACMPDVEERVKNYSSNLLADATGNYSRVKVERDNRNIKKAEEQYALYPAWILTYNFNGKIYVFAINGQSGKAFGELPVDNGKLYRTTGIIFAIIAVLLVLGGLFIW